MKWLAASKALCTKATMKFATGALALLVGMGIAHPSGKASTIVDSLGQATTSTQFSVFGSGGLLLHGQQLVGPRFTLNNRTMITEVGGFISSAKTISLGIAEPNTLPHTIQFHPSINGLPDMLNTLATFELSDDGAPLIIGYESATPNIILGPGTYFALFGSRGEDSGILLESSFGPPRYQGESVMIGVSVPLLVEERHAAVRILGKSVPESGGTLTLLGLGLVATFCYKSHSRSIGVPESRS